MKSSSSFLKIAVSNAILFLIIFTILKIVFAIFRIESFSEGIKFYFTETNLIPFIRLQLISAVFYGLFIAGYYKFIKK